MPVDLVSLLRIVLANVKSWWFWLLFITLFVIGCGLKYMPLRSQERLCERLQQEVTSPEDLSTWIRNACAGGRLPNARMLTIIVTALTLTAVLMSAVPKPDGRDTITDKTKQAEDIANPSTPFDEQAAKAIALEYLNLAIRARQLRIALGYSLACGAAAFIVPIGPAGTAPDTLAPSEGLLNMIFQLGAAPHLMTQGCIAVIAATLGIFGFSQTDIGRTTIALRLGGGGLLVGGVIATSIALPYLMTGPIPTLSPPRLLGVAAFRLAVLPGLGVITAYVILPRLREAAPIHLARLLARPGS